MISIPDRIILVAVIFTAFFFLSCKDDNVVNAYLNLTELNRIDYTINLNSDYKLVNITIYDTRTNEPEGDANVTLKFPYGSILTGKTNSSGNVKFILEKSIAGACEIYAESDDNVSKGKTNFEVLETFNYSLSIYIKE